MEYLIGLIALLGGGLFFYRTKAKSAESLNDNIKTKEEALAEDRKIAKEQGGISAEQTIRDSVQSATDEELKGTASDEELVAFFNDLDKRSKR